MFGPTHRYFATRLWCVAKGHHQTENKRSWKVQKKKVYDFTILRIYDFRNSLLSGWFYSVRRRNSEVADRSVLCSSVAPFPVLALVSIRSRAFTKCPQATCFYGKSASRALRIWGRFMNLWIYEILFRVGNLTPSKEDKSMWRPGGPNWVLSFLVMCGRVYRYLATRLCCGAKGHVSTGKTRPVGIQKMGSFTIYEFMILLLSFDRLFFERPQRIPNVRGDKQR